MFLIHFLTLYNVLFLCHFWTNGVHVLLDIMMYFVMLLRTFCIITTFYLLTQ